MKDKWKKNKVKIVFAILAAVILSGAFFWGGNYPKSTGSLTRAESSDSSISTDATALVAPEEDRSTDTPTADKSESSGLTGSGRLEEEKSSSEVTTGNAEYSEAQSMKINPQSGEDQYKTEPVPSGKPVPVEPEDAIITDKTETCTLSVSCETILDNMNLLDKDKWELVPKDGVIYAAKIVTFYEGESVFNVLQREMKKAGIQMEFNNTPIYNSVYIEGMNNLYEFDVGELSGWVYEINGWFPNYGCSRYQLQDGDVIQWLYTCDLGKDVGGSNVEGE